VRNRVVIATKFGWNIQDGKSVGLDSSPEKIRRVADASLQRLRTDHIDLFYQHRVDPNIPIEEVAGTVGELVQAGEVRHLGLSEPAAATIRRAHAIFPVTAVQSEYSSGPATPNPKCYPPSPNSASASSPSAPFGKGFLTGTVNTDTVFTDQDIRTTIPRFTTENREANQALVHHVTMIARAKGATPGQIALA